MTRHDPAAADDELVAVGCGDAEAFARLYDATASRVYGLTRLIVDEQCAADATVTTFVRVWRTAPAFDPEVDSAEQWVLRIAHRAAAELRREHTNVQQGAVLHATSDEGGDLALDALPAQQRTALALVYLRGHCCADAALLMGMSRTAVHELVLAGLLALRTAR